MEDVEGAGDADTLDGPALGVLVVRLVTLPIRKRGTRVWIFCSNTLTRARISETICTPRLLAAVLVTVLVELIIDTLRLIGVGRMAGVRGGRRVGVPDQEGTVVERVRGEGMELGVDREVDFGG